MVFLLQAPRPVTSFLRLALRSRTVCRPRANRSRRLAHRCKMVFRRSARGSRVVRHLPRTRRRPLALLSKVVCRQPARRPATSFRPRVISSRRVPRLCRTGSRQSVLGFRMACPRRVIRRHRLVLPSKVGFLRPAPQQRMSSHPLVPLCKAVFPPLVIRFRPLVLRCRMVFRHLALGFRTGSRLPRTKRRPPVPLWRVASRRPARPPKMGSLRQARPCRKAHRRLALGFRTV